ncbi:hypothetical protein HHK36_008665 [Tetracentron sinense]|uniref:Probable magnesium transporter n=1 Tax=Tetracentron sinense TaxID=13715 RepID=A0A835DNE9_TETSI|nr:hypothetical protein HHK36_008665 [Tetracentron sinense]
MIVSDNARGLVLAVLSSAFIGASFILKKKGLKRAGASGPRAGSVPAVMAAGVRGKVNSIPLTPAALSSILDEGDFKWSQGVGGYTYLLEPLWWAGMVTMIVGEVANFVAYVFAPAVLVTPLGALSIIVSAVLAHFMLKERLQKMGVLGCVSCIVGSVVIVIHAPQEHTPNSVQEIWALATQPAFLFYIAASLVIVLALVLHFEPHYGQTNILVYLGICSLMGSLTVVSIKAIGIAIKLTLDGISQVAYPQTWLFVTVAVICVITQLNYLNKGLVPLQAAVIRPKLFLSSPKKLSTILLTSSKPTPKPVLFNIIVFIAWVQIIALGIENLHHFLQPAQLAEPDNYKFFNVRETLFQALDTFNTAIVSPIYYVMFTTLTIIASAIMFKDWSGQNVSSIASEICGFITVISGTIILHTTREQEPDPGPVDLNAPLVLNAAGTISWYISGESIKNIGDDHFITLRSSDHFDQ